MIKEMCGTVFENTGEDSIIVCGKKKIRVHAILPCGMNVHFFCDDATGDGFEIMPDTPKTADDLRGYITTSGRIPNVSGSDADALSDDELASVAFRADEALPKVREKLGDDKTDALIAYFKVQPQNDATYLTLKRKFSQITWEEFSACVGDPPHATSIREITENPYAFFLKSGMPYSKIDMAAVALGAKVYDGIRIDAFVDDMFRNRGLKNSVCCPKDVLVKCISAGLSLPEMDAETYVNKAIFNDSLIKEADADNIYVYTPLNHRVEKALVGHIKNACARKTNIAGIVGAVKSCRADGDEITDAEEIVLREAAKAPVCVIVTDTNTGMHFLNVAETCFIRLGVPVKVILPNAQSYTLKATKEDERSVTFIARADEISYSEYFNIFSGLKTKEKVILVGADKDRPNVSGRVFLDVAKSGICPVFGTTDIPETETKYSMLKTFLQRD